MATTLGPTRDYLRLLHAYTSVIDSLYEGGDHVDAIHSSFDDIVAGLGAQKALVLTPTKEGKGFAEIVVSTMSVKPSHKNAIQSGVSVKGVSTSVIREVIANKQARIIEHPMLMANARKTASLDMEDYSVMCAPILNRVGDVVFVYYFQNSGLSLTNAYREADLLFLTSFLKVVQSILQWHEYGQNKLRELIANPELSYKEVTRKVAKMTIEERLVHFGNNYKQAMDSLNLKPGHFYRVIGVLGIPKKYDDKKQRAEDAEAEAAEQSDDVVDPS